MAPQTTFASTAPMWQPGWQSALAVAGRTDYTGLGPCPTPSIEQQAVLGRQAIQALRNSGLTKQEIADKLRMDSRVVTKALHPGYGATGRTTPVTDHAYTVLAPFIRELLADGRSVRGIARDFEVSAYAVRRVRDGAASSYSKS
jgi:hypothetical protein